MDIVVSTKSDKPIYRQIYEQISAQILQGVLPQGFCLPSIRMIAAELNISVITIKKAWELLEENKFIITVSGKGCYVNNLSSQHIEYKKYSLAAEKLRKNLPFYKNLGLSYDELTDLISKEY